MKILYLIFVLLIEVAVIKAECPKETGRRCECTDGVFYEGKGTKVECRYIGGIRELQNEIQSFRGYPIDFLKLIEIDVSYFPSGLFSGTSVKRLFIEDSTLDNLYSVRDYRLSPFDGLDDSLEEIHITSTQDPSRWYWPDLKHLKKMKKFEIVQSPIDFVGHVFAEIGGGSLESITVAYSNVYRIHPQAFPELTNLREANFAGNHLPYLVRTMFANPAPRLEKLDFRHNQIFTLPENMFENMPALKFLDLSENKFKNYETADFSPVWNQLQTFYISDNPFECDCSLLPLKEKLISGSIPQKNDFHDVMCRNKGDDEKTLLKNLEENSLQCS